MNMSHGDGDTIPEDLEEGYFPPNFKEYMLNEQLKWSRFKAGDRNDTGWVFWSQHDHEITRALQKWISDPLHSICCLVQFWAASKTLEGRTRLTTQFQPFALSPSYSTGQRQQLCEYRMKMCSSEYNNCFYADAQSGEEQLGLPGRVFLHQFTESTPYVEYYSTKEYPQRDLALRCKIFGSWAVPVFEQSSSTCVGVLEMVSRICTGFLATDWPIGYSPRRMEKNLQDFGLQCGYQACVKESRKRGKRVKGFTNAFQELQMVLRSVCQIHELPLSMTWVPCSACNGLQRCKLGSTGVEFRSQRGFKNFVKVIKCHHMRKGQFAGRALPFSSMLYCSDITQLSVDEYPLVPYARECKLSGWFTICLQNVNTGNDIYVLEFFLSARSKDDEDIHTTLSSILGTMDKNFKTFRLASGKELGELTSVDFIYFQNDKKIHSVRRIQATRDFSTSIASSVQSSASVAYTGPGFHDANMGTIEAKFDLNFDQFSDSDPSFEQSSTSVANTRPGFQDANMVIIKAKYDNHSTKFKLSLPCRLLELQQKVVERLKLEAGTYHVGYKEEDEFVLIALDKDLQDYVDDSILQGNTSTVVLLKPKEPATNLSLWSQQPT